MKPLFEVYPTLPPGFPFSWCSVYGEDRMGIWVEFTVRYGEGNKRKVKQRMRWIHPGRFTMGSPLEEEERYEDEIPHEVNLTEGYWLADTDCTQELWEAVMEENPSSFKGPMRPVENISWNNCLEFLHKINTNPELHGISLCLPTEVQWEYACRAGTLMPFSFGENITTDQVNYNGNHPYASGDKGNFREVTVDVKTFPPNKWGLYEMHGNVFEWCSDWYSEYPVETVINPTNLEKDGTHVLRGGSWGSYARYCRSAFRGRSGSGVSNIGIGIRLSRCQ